MTNLRSSWLGKAGTAATTETSPSLAVTKHARDLADEAVKEQEATLRQNARQAPKIIPKTERGLANCPALAKPAFCFSERSTQSAVRTLQTPAEEPKEEAKEGTKTAVPRCLLGELPENWTAQIPAGPWGQRSGESIKGSIVPPTVSLRQRPTRYHDQHNQKPQ